VCKIIALGQTDAEEAALLWASDNGILTERSCLLPNANLSFSRMRHMGWLLENAVQSDGTLLLTRNFPLGPEQSKAIEFLGANKKPFLHLWSSSVQGGLALT